MENHKNRQDNDLNTKEFIFFCVKKKKKKIYMTKRSFFLCLQAHSLPTPMQLK